METRIAPPVAGFPSKLRKYTSNLPDSFEAYAIARPSGENAGSISSNSELRNANGLPPGTGSTQISECVLPPSTENARYLPSALHADGHFRAREISKGSSGPTPSSLWRYRFASP